jgi:hypothetical protein
MAKYRKKPVVVETVQWTGDNIPEVTAFLNGGGKFVGVNQIEVTTVHGEKALIRVGDWIMPEPVAGRFYPCKPDIFAATYDPA